MVLSIDVGIILKQRLSDFKLSKVGGKEQSGVSGIIVNIGIGPIFKKMLNKFDIPIYCCPYQGGVAFFILSICLKQIIGDVKTPCLSMVSPKL